MDAVRTKSVAPACTTAKTGRMAVVPSSEMPWQTYRDVRLRALETDPSQFGSTYEREVTFSDEVWAERALTVGTFLWIPADEPDASSRVAPRAEGVASALPFPPDEAQQLATHYDVDADRIGALVQVWVQPSARGSGVIDELLEYAIASARRRGWHLLVLHVRKANDRAAAVYRRHGFVRSDPAAFGEDDDEAEYTLTLC